MRRERKFSAIVWVKRVINFFTGKSAECTNCPCLNGEGLSEYIHENVMTEKAYIIKHKDTVWDGKKAYLDIAFDITNTEEIQKRLEQRLDMEHILVSCIG